RPCEPLTPAGRLCTLRSMNVHRLHGARRPRTVRAASSALPLLLAIVLLGGCSRGPTGASASSRAAASGESSAASASGALHHDALSRDEFNRRAAANFLPLFWRADANHDRTIEPNELAVLAGYPDSDVNRWVDQSGDFTQRFEQAYASLLHPQPPA